MSLTFTEPNGTADEAYATRQWVLTDTVNISQDDYDGLYAGFTMPETSGDTLALYACSNQDGTYNQPYLHDYRLITQWTPVTETEAVQG